MTLNKSVTDQQFMHYQGPFTIQVISTLAKLLMENVVANANEKNKLYRIFIELAQNIALYSNERMEAARVATVGIGEVYVVNKPNEFKCVAINEIHKLHETKLVNNCAEINSLSNKALNDKKNALRKIAHIQDTGAHIGLIMVCSYSENPIDFEVINSNDKLYFKISANVSKGK